MAGKGVVIDSIGGTPSGRAHQQTQESQPQHWVCSPTPCPAKALTPRHVPNHDVPNHDAPFLGRVSTMSYWLEEQNIWGKREESRYTSMEGFLNKIDVISLHSKCKGFWLKKLQ